MGKRKHNPEDDDDSSNQQRMKKHCNKVDTDDTDDTDNTDDTDITTNQDINWSQLESYINPIDYASDSQSSIISQYPAIWVAPTHLKNYF